MHRRVEERIFIRRHRRISLLDKDTENLAKTDGKTQIKTAKHLNEHSLFYSANTTYLYFYLYFYLEKHRKKPVLYLTLTKKNLLSTMASNTNKRSYPDKPTDPRPAAANKRQKTPAPKAKAAENPPQGSNIRTEQELEAEARQTQLDLGFILVLSEDPQKALQIAKTDLEREAAINAIEVQKIVSKIKTTNSNKNLASLPTFQNAKTKSKQQPRSMPDLYPNLSAAADKPPPQPTTNFEQMKAQFEQLKKKQETVDARQKQLQAQREAEGAPPCKPSRTATTTLQQAATTTTTTTMTTTASIRSKPGLKASKQRTLLLQQLHWLLLNLTGLLRQWTG